MLQGSILDAQSEEFTIPANGQLNVPIGGEFVRCLEATDNFKIAVNGGAKLYFASGMEYRPPNIDGFDSFTMYNETGTDIDVVMGWGAGDLNDNRLTASGNLHVQNVVGEKLNVDDADTQAAIASLEIAVDSVTAEVTAINALLQSDIDQRQALTTLAGASYAEVTTATTTTVVTAGANTNGVIIRQAMIASNNSGTTVQITVGGNSLMYTQAGYSCFSIQNIYVPAGNAIAIQSGGVNTKALIWYEVL